MGAARNARERARLLAERIKLNEQLAKARAAEDAERAAQLAATLAVHLLQGGQLAFCPSPVVAINSAQFSFEPRV